MSGNGPHYSQDLRFNFMRYRETEYQMVQTSSPTGWKWTVQMDDKRTRTGSGITRAHAIGLAQRAIDKILSAPAEDFGKGLV
jgi:hypothetical protein